MSWPGSRVRRRVAEDEDIGVVLVFANGVTDTPQLFPENTASHSQHAWKLGVPGLFEKRQTFTPSVLSSLNGIFPDQTDAYGNVMSYDLVEDMSTNWLGQTTPSLTTTTALRKVTLSSASTIGGTMKFLGPPDCETLVEWTKGDNFITYASSLPQTADRELCFAEGQEKIHEMKLSLGIAKQFAKHAAPPLQNELGEYQNLGRSIYEFDFVARHFAAKITDYYNIFERADYNYPYYYNIFDRDMTSQVQAYTSVTYKNSVLQLEFTSEFFEITYTPVDWESKTKQVCLTVKTKYLERTTSLVVYKRTGHFSMALDHEQSTVTGRSTSEMFNGKSTRTFYSKGVPYPEVINIKEEEYKKAEKEDDAYKRSYWTFVAIAMMVAAPVVAASAVRIKSDFYPWLLSKMTLRDRTVFQRTRQMEEQRILTIRQTRQQAQVSVREEKYAAVRARRAGANQQQIERSEANFDITAVLYSKPAQEHVAALNKITPGQLSKLQLYRQTSGALRIDWKTWFDLGLDISRWDVSEMTTMAGLFAYCTVADLPVSAWDVSKVTDMSNMFANSAFVGGQALLRLWDVSNVRNMAGMFDGCKTFNSDLSPWNVANVNDMREMFRGCENLDTDLASWEVGNVESMENMFSDCNSFDSDLSAWDVSNVTNMERMFYGASVFSGDVETWNVSKVDNVEEMFRWCARFQGDLGVWFINTMKVNHANCFAGSGAAMTNVGFMWGAHSDP